MKLFKRFFRGMEKQAEITVVEKSLGAIEGGELKEFTLSNEAANFRLSFLNLGGIITRVETPDRSGVQRDVILGFDDPVDYSRRHHPYFNGVVGRFAGRIEGATFSVGEETYQLTKNPSGLILHSGSKCTIHKLWDCEVVDTAAGGRGVRLSIAEPDGTEGFPGAMQMITTYSLQPGAQGVFVKEFEANTDKSTAVNITTHEYWNLAGVTSEEASKEGVSGHSL